MPPTESQHATPETAIAVMSRDIHYMKQSLERIEKSFSEIAKNSISRTEFEAYRLAVETAQKEKDRDFEAYKLSISKCTDDHESRMRTAETSITRIVTWGSAGVLLLGIAEFLIGKFL